MKINIAMRSEARGEGELIRIARSLQMPNLRDAEVNGDNEHGWLRTTVRAGSYNGIDNFIVRLKRHGFFSVEGEDEGQYLFHKAMNTTASFVRQGSRIVIKLVMRFEG